jgi:hypothetical protein
MSSFMIGSKEVGFKLGPIDFGVGLAIGMSYYVNHSILWAVVHGLLNWCYIGYKAAPWVATHIGMVLR